MLRRSVTQRMPVLPLAPTVNTSGSILLREAVIKEQYPQQYTPARHALIARLKIDLSVEQVETICKSTAPPTKGHRVASQIIHAHFRQQFPNMPQMVIQRGVDVLLAEQSLTEVARRCGFQHCVKEENIAELPLRLLQELPEQQQLKFVQQQILPKAFDWELLIAAPEENLKDTVRKLFGQHNTRLLSESGRQSPLPIFVVGVFVRSHKLGEGFGQSLSMAQHRARHDVLLKYYLSPVGVDPKNSQLIKTIGEGCGVNSLNDDVAAAIAQDAEFHLREVVQDALKFMRHAKRGCLTTEDVNHALQLKGIQRMYGFQENNQLQFKSVSNPQLGEIFYIEDEEVEFEDILTEAAPKAPAESVVTGHWLMVEGVQPAIPQNPAPIESRIENLSRKLKNEGKFDILDRKTEVKPLVRHVLSKELQIYYGKIVEALLSGSPELNNAALDSIREDNGIQQLLPYFVQFVTEQIASNLKNLAVLVTMSKVIAGFLSNQHFFVEPYLHQLMPPILSLMISKTLGTGTQEHWQLRVYAATLMARICFKYNSSYQTLQPRVTRTLLKAFVDPEKSFTSHYGAIVGLKLLGSEVVRALVVPNVQLYVELAQQRLETEDADKAMQALKDAVVTYLVSEVKKQSLSTMQTDTSNALKQIERFDEIKQAIPDIEQQVNLSLGN